jgi:hypothetical protein
MSRRRLATGALLLVTAGAVTPVLATSSSAASDSQACAFYYALGAADGVRTALAANNFLPLTDATDVEGPAAHALINSGDSEGYAGAPYPGDFAYTAPGLGGVDPSTYPAAAKSSYPTKSHAQAGQGPYSLSSDSAALSTKADAFVGGGAAGGTGTTAGSSESRAQAACSASGITADSVTDTDALNVQATLRIGRIHSEAHAIMAPDGKVQLTSALSLAQVTIAGQTVEINTQGLSAGGQTVPLPNPLDAVLKSQGMRLQYVAPVKDADGHGITAPGLLVSATLPLNQPPLSLATSPGVVTYTFGRAYAKVDGGFQSGPDLSGGGSTNGGGTGATTGTTGGTGGSNAGGPAGPTSSGGLPTGSTGSTTPNSGQQPVVAGSGQLQAAALNVPALDWQLLYLAITVGAFAVAGGGLLIRHLAERLRWT